MNFWDQQFAAPGFKYGTTPNAFLEDQTHRLSPMCDVLLPGDGEGRNSVWMARQGHRVTALDSSIVGLEKAKGLAESNRVSIQLLHANLEDWVAPIASFDAVALIYLHLPEPLRTRTHRQLFDALRPGGHFILEAFHPRQLGYTSGGPKSENMLYTVGMIRSDLEIGSANKSSEVLACEGEFILDEGPGHQGPAFLTRYVARKLAV